jgi:hypothetical protein
MDIAPHLYKNTMIEVKRRFLAIDRILGTKKGKPRTLNEEFDNEFMWLQVRKIIELVAFGGVMADEQRYAAIRAEAKDNPDYKRDWKVGSILKKLAEITPHYLPVPIGDLLPLPDGRNHFLKGDEEQTLERFVTIYNDAGDHLHVPNPFAFETLADFQRRLETSRECLKVEVRYLKKVLWNHAKIGLEFDGVTDSPRHVGNPDTAWIVHFGKPQAEEISMVLAKAEAE